MKETENFKVVESLQVENIYEVFKINSGKYFILKTIWEPNSSTEEITEEQAKEYYNLKLNIKQI